MLNLKYAICRNGNWYIGCDISSVIDGRDIGILITYDVESATDCDIFIDCTNADVFMNNNCSKEN